MAHMIFPFLTLSSQLCEVDQTERESDLSEVIQQTLWQGRDLNLSLPDTLTTKLAVGNHCEAT